MNVKSLTMMITTTLLAMAAGTSQAATFDSRSYNVSTDLNFNQDIQGPASLGLLTSTQSIAPTPNSTTSAKAAANDLGQSAVKVDGFYDCAPTEICDFQESAKTSYQLSYTNQSSDSVHYTYNYTVTDIVVEIRDDVARFGFGTGVPNGPTASAANFVSLFVDNVNVDSVFSKLELVGGALGHNVTSTGDMPAPTFFTTADSFGYRIDSLSGSFSGTLAAGQTLNIFTGLEAKLFLHGDGNLPILQTVGLVGGRASIGDPNNLAISPLEGTLTITAVPIPGAVWLFGSGLMGLFGMARRSRRG